MIVRVALLVLKAPFAAVTCAGVVAVTRPVVTWKVMELAPAGTVICAGTLTAGLRKPPGARVRGVAAPVSLLVSATVTPPAGAGPLSRTSAVEVVPPRHWTDSA